MPKNLAKFLAPPTKQEKAALAASPPAGRVYGYARVSTTMQATDGESLDVQQRTIAGYAQMHGLTVEHVFVERGVSGSKPLAERPEGSALIAALKPGDTVITPKLDRMFRSALDALDILAQMKGAGIALHMIDLGGDTTTNGVSKLVFTILSAVAEAERDRTSARWSSCVVRGFPSASSANRSPPRPATSSPMSAYAASVTEGQTGRRLAGDAAHIGQFGVGEPATGLACRAAIVHRGGSRQC
jgi:DNA invertase Pin-like site-specific DNA recombinase